MKKVNTEIVKIWTRKSNIENLLKALKDFGFASHELKLDDFPGHILQLVHPPNRIDLHTDLQGVDFKTWYKNRVDVEIEGVKANFIDLENPGKKQESNGASSRFSGSGKFRII